MMDPAELQSITWRADLGVVWLWVLVGGLLLAGWQMRRWPWLMRRLQPLMDWAAAPHPLLWITLAGALLRVPRLFDSLWYDEAFTARMVSLPLDQLMTAIAGDVHPPGWYGFAWLLTRLTGQSEAGLRFPSFLCGLLLIPLGHRLARALGLSERTALVYAGLVAVLPAALYFSAEARGYTLLSVLVIAALIGLLERRLWLAAVPMMLMPLVHNIGFIWFGLLTLAGMAFDWSDAPATATAWRRMAVRALAVLPGLLWLPVMLNQSSDVADGFWLQAMNAGLGLGALIDTTVTRTIQTEWAGPVLAVAIGATIYGVAVYRRWLFGDARGRVLALAVLGVPLALAVIAWLWLPVYLTRALLPAGIGVALIWARLLVERPFSRLFIGPALALALLSFYSPSLWRFDMGRTMDACQNAAGVYVTGIPAGLFAGYYLPAAEMRIWEQASDINQSLSREAQAAMNLQAGTYEELPAPRCLLYLQTPNSTAAERAEVERALAGHPHTSSEYWVNRFFRIVVYQEAG